MTLAEFLLARIAEDEAAVRAVDTHDWSELRYMTPGYTLDRVLAECEAKRRIVGWCTEVIGSRDLTTYGQHGALADDPDALAVTLAVETLRALALPYAEHPDYREEWKP